MTNKEFKATCRPESIEAKCPVCVLVAERQGSPDAVYRGYAEIWPQLSKDVMLTFPG
jgi:hypothetical protein